MSRSRETAIMVLVRLTARARPSSLDGRPARRVPLPPHAARRRANASGRRDRPVRAYSSDACCSGPRARARQPPARTRTGRAPPRCADCAGARAATARAKVPCLTSSGNRTLLELVMVALCITAEEGHEAKGLVNLREPSPDQARREAARASHTSAIRRCSTARRLKRSVLAYGPAFGGCKPWKRTTRREPGQGYRRAARLAARSRAKGLMRRMRGRANPAPSSASRRIAFVRIPRLLTQAREVHSGAACDVRTVGRRLTVR